jgi:hypothetical protein
MIRHTILLALSDIITHAEQEKKSLCDLLNISQQSPWFYIYIYPNKEGKR